MPLLLSALATDADAPVSQSLYLEFPILKSRLLMIMKSLRNSPARLPDDSLMNSYLRKILYRYSLCQKEELS
jgi:hypothetical protein